MLLEVKSDSKKVNFAVKEFNLFSHTQFSQFAQLHEL